MQDFAAFVHDLLLLSAFPRRNESVINLGKSGLCEPSDTETDLRIGSSGARNTSVEATLRKKNGVPDLLGTPFDWNRQG
jgi:hypothetical protein